MTVFTFHIDPNKRGVPYLTPEEQEIDDLYHSLMGEPCCMECDDCRKMSGTPVLCRSCLERRELCLKNHILPKRAEEQRRKELLLSSDGAGI